MRKGRRRPIPSPKEDGGCGPHRAGASGPTRALEPTRPGPSSASRATTTPALLRCGSGFRKLDPSRSSGEGDGVAIHGALRVDADGERARPREGFSARRADRRPSGAFGPSPLEVRVRPQTGSRELEPMAQAPGRRSLGGQIAGPIKARCTPNARGRGRDRPRAPGGRAS